MIHPLHLYADGLRRAGEPGMSAVARLRDGSALPVALHRFVSAADPTDARVLRSVRGPVLDVGCGQGRHLHLLAARGVFALGVDLSPVAVQLARGGGGNAIVASIFDELPGAGRWRSALLLDGNIGIGGAPGRLLVRLRALLAAGGELLIELDPSVTTTVETYAQLETPLGTSAWFPWARVAMADVERIAAANGFAAGAPWSDGGRWFAKLVKHELARPVADPLTARADRA